MAEKFSLQDKTILLIISGGISAYKALEVIRMLKAKGAAIPAVLTKGGSEFITALSISGLSGAPVYTDLFSLKDEQEMGHIRLSREADLICAIPASANLMARCAHGLADDLASTVLLASNKPIMMFPAMNPEMWQNPATQDNVSTLKARGITVIEPDEGEMACGEIGKGRLPAPEAIIPLIENMLSINSAPRPLEGKTALVTAGPTYEAIDPVRFIGNRSSGKQGYAIARELAKQGAKVTLISGPTSLKPPAGIHMMHIESADQMYKAALDNLPCDIAICAAAVSDWKSANPANEKLKKRDNGSAPSLSFTENPDILKSISTHSTKRPELVIGFAAETDNVTQNATDKFERKGCDLLLANHVKKTGDNVFGADNNEIICFERNNNSRIVQQPWPHQSKDDVACQLVNKIIDRLDMPKHIDHSDTNVTTFKASK